MQGWTGINSGCSKMKHLDQDEAGEARNDQIRGQDSNERKKHFRKREGPTQTGNLPWYMAGSQPMILSKEWVS